MNVRLKFLGGARTVTGSKYLLEVDSLTIMVDCGMFQGLKQVRSRNWDPLPVDVKKLDAVVITHAHIDHIGYLPRLVADGYRGPIYMTHATADLAELLLFDSAKLQEEEAEYANKRGYSRHHPAKPLYNSQDVERVLPLIRSVEFDQDVSITHAITFRYRLAGHILGAAIVEMWVQGQEQRKKITFSGDLGRYDQPIMHDPTAITETDILLLESTYGNRTNPYQNVLLDMAKYINEALDAGGLVIIPSFAVGRTQELLYHLHSLIQMEAIPKVPVFVDSPMAISATHLYKRHSQYHKLDEEGLINLGKDVFEADWVHYVTTPEMSMGLNSRKGDAIIISASGMCTGGRITHHLYHRLGNAEDTLLFAGFQAEGSRGREILEGAESVRIFGEPVKIRCRIRKLNGLSAHADQTELRRWVSNFKERPKQTFITHGEYQGASVLAQVLEDEFTWPNITVPDYLASYELFKGI